MQRAGLCGWVGGWASVQRKGHAKYGRPCSLCGCKYSQQRVVSLLSCNEKGKRNPG